MTRRKSEKAHSWREMGPSPVSAKRRRLGPIVEACESRCLFSVFTVTNVNPSGAGSLAEAISDSNQATGSTNTINFEIAPSTVETIAPNAPLPDITNPVLIDGSAPSGFAGQRIVISGSGGSISDAFIVDSGAAGTTIQDLVISDFSDCDVELNGNNCTIAGNYLGTDVTGTFTDQVVSGSDTCNGGITVNSSGNTIGGTAPGEGNVVDGCYNAVSFNGTSAFNNSLLGNFIGTNAGGTAAIEDDGGNPIQGNNEGVVIQSGATQTTVGGPGAGAGNVISNNQFGVLIYHGPTLAGGNVIQGNMIGADITGTIALSNSYYGMGIDGQTTDNQIGGTAAGDGNVIAGTAYVDLLFFGGTDTQVQGNYIGTNSDGATDLGGAHYGIYMENEGAGDLIGGPQAGAGNVFANSSEGLVISGSTNVTVQGNFFGTDPAGDTGLGNTEDGIDLWTGSNLIGGPAAGDGNVISGNSYGILINGSNSTNNVVQGNFIGTDPAGTAALGNTNNGMSINDGAHDNTIGGTLAADANVISGNGVDGIEIAQGGTISNQVLGNDIGTDKTGAAALGNGLDGIQLLASNNSIGGIAPGSGNVIAYNNTGVAVGTDATTTGDSILSNRIFANTTIGIDLGSDGPTANQANPAASANAGQNYPLLTALTNNAVSGTLASAPSSAYRVEIFGTPSGGGALEGQTLLGYVTVDTDASGNAAFSITLASAPAADTLTATATNLTTGATSEFSPAGTTTALTSSQSTSAFGQDVTFTATVSAAIGAAPTGSVEFSVNGSPYSSVALVNGQATLDDSALSAGAYIITAAYTPDASSFSASSGTAQQTVNPAGTTVSVTSDGNPSAIGQLVTFTATVASVSPAVGTPTGLITLYVDGAAYSTTTLIDGQATFPDSILNLGNHAIFAVYSPDSGNFAMSNNLTSPLTEQVQPASTNTAVSSNPSPSEFGQGLTFTATVNAVVPAMGTPTGSVEFFVDGVSCGSGTLSNHQASISGITPGYGSHDITAVYTSDSDDFVGSTSDAWSQFVSAAPTLTTVTSSHSSATYSQNVTFTATVASQVVGSGTPAGSVEFYVDGDPRSSATLSGGHASLADASLAEGVHNITAVYTSSSANFGGSNDSGTPLVQGVSAAATTTTVTSSNSPSSLEQSVTFTATVAPIAPGTATPGGSVAFYVDNAPATTVTLAAGSASFTDSDLGVGSHDITAVYSSDTVDFAGSNNTNTPLPQQVGAADTTTSVSSSNSSSTASQNVVFTATVGTGTPAAGTPAGTVQFYINGTPFQSATLVNGQASISDAALSTGAYNVTATYTPASGGNFNGSTTANALVQNVSKPAATFSNLSAPTILLHAPSQTFSGTIGGIAGEVPGGSVAITLTYATGAKAGQSAATATAPIGAGGSFSASVTITTTSKKVVTGLPAGAYTVTYSYAGDTNYAAASASTSAYISYKLAPSIAPAKPAATLTAKLKVEDAKGVNVSGPAIAVTVVGIAASSTPSTLIPLPAGTSHAFTYASHAYQLKLKNPGLAPGNYLLSVTLAGDPTPQTLAFTIT